MSFVKMIVPLGLLTALAVSGCNSERFNAPYQSSNPPPPIRTVPAGQVSQSDLPPPDGYPAAPTVGNETQMASLETNDAGQWSGVRNGIDLTPALVAGVWKASLDDLPCQIATPMTKFGQGYRAGPMRCPVALASVNSWNVEGALLLFYDRDGAVVAQLSSANGSSFAGRTASGATLALTR